MWWFSDIFFCLVCGLLEKKASLIKHVGVFQAVCACALMQLGCIASDWAWLHEPMLGYQGAGPGRGARWAFPDAV